MQIYINRNGQQLGAFEESKVIEMLRNGQLSPNDFCIKPGENQWKTLGSIYPNATNAFSPTPVFDPQPQNYSKPAPRKKSSVGLVIGLLAIVGIFFLGIIGLGAFFFFGTSSSKPVSLTTESKTDSPPPTPKTTYEFLQSKPAELAKLKPPIKLESKAVLNGKTLIVEQRDKSNEYSAEIKGFSYSSFDTVNETDLSLYGLTKERLPSSLEELQTLVQVICGKGREVGRFGPRMAYVPLFANTCKVAIINYKESKIVYQKTIENAKKPAKIYVTDGENEKTLEMPTAEIQKFIKGLPSA